MDITQRPKRGRRGPPGPPGPAGTGGGAIATVSDSASIDMVLVGSDLSANAVVGTTAGTVAAGNHGHSHTALTNIGTNTHPQIDTHLADTANPHGVTSSQVGLGLVDNTSDAAKPVSTAQQTALNLKADSSALTAHTSDTANPHAVTKAQVGLGSVDNTSDANKPVSTAQAAADALRLPYTLFDAKGDLLAGTGADTGSKLTVGADGTFLKADSAQATGLAWVTVPGGGDVVGPAAAVDSEAALFSGTTGKLLKRATGTGLVKRTAGVDSIAVANTDYAEAEVNRFRLAADGAAIGPTIADFFGANSAFPTLASTIYEVEAWCFFTKTTAGTVLWTFAHSISMTAAAIGATTGNVAGSAGSANATLTVATVASASLTTGVKHFHYVMALIETNSAGNGRLRVTSSAGTVTPLRGSFYRVRLLSAANIGSFVA